MEEENNMQPDAAKKDFSGKFKLMQDQYLIRLKKSAKIVEGYIDNNDAGGLDRKFLTEIRDFTHGLAGSGAVFGFPLVSETARNVENYTAELLLGSLVIEDFKPEEKAKFGEILKELFVACEERATEPEKAEELVMLVDNQDEAPKFTVMPTVLLIDDDRNICDLLSYHLSDRNIRVRTAYNGQDGLASLKEVVPDLIILDICMPTLSGHEVMKALMSHPEFSKIPVLMLSAKKDEGNIVRALKDRAIGYIIKPFEIKKLVSRVEQILQEKFKKNKILIVDNDEFILKFLEEKFKSKGFQVFIANNGRTGLNQITQDKPDLVILDMIMPKMTGMEFIKKAREVFSAKELPILVLSTVSHGQQVSLAMQQGAQFYINKPFVFDNLFQTSLTLMNKYK